MRVKGTISMKAPETYYKSKLLVYIGQFVFSQSYIGNGTIISVYAKSNAVSPLTKRSSLYAFPTQKAAPRRIDIYLYTIANGSSIYAHPGCVPYTTPHTPYRNL